MLPSAQEIQAFVEIVSVKNITKAAQRLGVSQPTLSISLRRLEESVGEVLLIRSKNGVELTVAGKQFYLYAKKLLGLWQEAKEDVQRSVHAVRGNIKFGCHQAVGLYALERFIPNLLQDHSELEFTFVHDLSRKICQRIQDYELDVGLVINPAPHPDLILTKVCSDEVRLWRTSNSKTDVLLCHPELLQTQSILKKLKKNKFDFKRMITSDSLENLTKLTLRGCGIGIIPGRVVDVFDLKNKLQAIEGTSFKDELYLAYRMENKNVGYIQTIRNTIISSW